MICYYNGEECICNEYYERYDECDLECEIYNEFNEDDNYDNYYSSRL